jgi:hypothetical protein
MGMGQALSGPRTLPPAAGTSTDCTHAEKEFAVDSAFVITWKAPVPRREKKALDLVVELEKYWYNQAAQGHCTTPDVFLLSNGPGTVTVQGERHALEVLTRGEELRELLAKGRLLFQDWKCTFAKSGDEFMEARRSTLAYSRHPVGRW